MCFLLSFHLKPSRQLLSQTGAWGSHGPGLGITRPGPGDYKARLLGQTGPGPEARRPGLRFPAWLQGSDFESSKNKGGNIENQVKETVKK